MLPNPCSSHDLSPSSTRWISLIKTCILMNHGPKLPHYDPYWLKWPYTLHDHHRNQAFYPITIKSLYITWSCTCFNQVNISDKDMYPNAPWSQKTPLWPILTKMTIHSPRTSQGPAIIPHHYQITAHHMIMHMLQPGEYHWPRHVSQCPMGSKYPIMTHID